MNNRIRENSAFAETGPVPQGGSRFAMIEPTPPPACGMISPHQLHLLAFLQARALVERARWQRLLEKIFEQDE
jgi:hypothetical protein